MTDTNTRNDAQAIIDEVEKLHAPHVITLPGGQSVIATPKGIDLTSTKKFEDERRTAPERRAGTAKFTTIESFIEHVNRFSDPDSVVFADDDPKAPSLTAVLDYHRATAEGAPRFGKHRSTYGFPFSEQWKAWVIGAPVGINQARFAEFIEKNIADVVTPAVANGEMVKSVLGAPASPQKLLEVARGLQLNVRQNVVNAVTTSSGEVSLTFDTKHEGAKGGEVSVPTTFAVVIPVFKGGQPYEVTMRLRYRLDGALIVWTIEPFQADIVFEDALKEALAKVKEETKLPLLCGSPET